MAKIEAWKAFIQGRMAMENGDIESGLRAINEAMKLDPSEPIFSRTRDLSEGLVRKSTADSVAAELAADYNKMAKINIGANDKPDLWLKDLQELLNKADGRVSSAGVAW